MSKAIFYLLLFILFFGYRVQAQIYKGQQEFSLTYGMVSGRQIIDFFTVDEDGGGIIDTKHSGNPFFSYHYYITDHFAVGCTFGNQYIRGLVAVVNPVLQRFSAAQYYNSAGDRN